MIRKLKSETVDIQSKSLAFWHMLGAGVRNNLYSEGRHSLFLVCITVFQIWLQLWEWMVSICRHSASSIQTIGDCGSPLEIKAIQGSFWHSNILKPPANRSGKKHFCSQWGCQVSIYVTKAYIKQCYLSNLSPGPEAGMYEVVVYYLHPFNLITWILTVWVLLDIGTNEWCNSLVEGCVPFIIIINQRVNNQVLHRHIYTQIGYLGKEILWQHGSICNGSSTTEWAVMKFCTNIYVPLKWIVRNLNCLTVWLLVP